MVYSFVYTSKAQKDLAKIDDSISSKILKKLDYFIELPDPLAKAKQLTGFEIPTFSFRIGDYRVIFRRDKKGVCLVVLVVLRVAHRREVYKKL
ncbi:MAG: type II toxin-antitoxin system RelE/ParE family toxin [Patescibacteria group bacterium]